MMCDQAVHLLPRLLDDALPPPQTQALRAHLDACAVCWTSWDHLRWTAAASSPLYDELAAYLGARFVPYLDSSHLLAQQWDNAHPSSSQEIRDFYASTEAYLYNQVIWHASGNRPCYVEAALPLLRGLRASTVLDFGSGIGQDTLALHHEGFEVTACDLPSPQVSFFHWRAPRHAFTGLTLDPLRLAHAPAFDVVWAIDVLDHLPDIDQALDPILPHAQAIITEAQRQDRAHGTQGFHTRRGAKDINKIMKRYGLEPQTMSPTAPISAWQRQVLPPQMINLSEKTRASQGRL